MFRKSLALILATLLPVFPAAFANNGNGHINGNGIFTSEFSFESNTGYVECIGESMDTTLNVLVRSRFFQTPSGATHILDNWLLEGIAVGTVSGNTWSIYGTFPFRRNGKGEQETDGAKLNLVYHPLDGQRKLKVDLLGHYTADANGVVRVFLDNYKFTCRGN